MAKVHAKEGEILALKASNASDDTIKPLVKELHVLAELQVEALKKNDVFTKIVSMYNNVRIYYKQ